MTSPTQPSPETQPEPQKVQRLHRWLLHGLQVVLGLGLAGALYEQQWQNALLIGCIIGIMFVPTWLHRRFRVVVPAEFEILAVVFAFASVFLGEIRDYYTRFWWWDIALHGFSGLLLGLFGFLLVYVLNADEEVDLHMRPRFVALFAFVFAVAVGGLWEVFEFSMDQLVGTTMQKPMLGDPSGLTDTMWDLVVDTVGAALISWMGWWYMRRQKASFIYRWIRKFIAANPQLFN